MIAYLLLFVFVVFAFLLAKEGTTNEAAFYAFVFVALVAFAGFRGPEIDRDYATYERLYRTIQPLGRYANGNATLPTDVGYVVVASLARHTFGFPFVSVTVVFAAFAVGLKLFAIRRLAVFPTLAVVVYMCSYFLLHEMTQIRVGVATGFILVGLHPLSKGQRFRFLLWLVPAGMFHASALLFLMLVFVKRGRTRKGLYYGVIVASVFMALSRTGIYELAVEFAAATIFPRLKMYSDLVEEGFHAEINLFHPLVLVRLVFASWFIFRVDDLAEALPAAHLAAKAYAVSIFCYYAFQDLPVLAYRSRELLGIMEILLLPATIAVLRYKREANELIIAFSSSVFFGYLFLVRLLGPYQFAV